MKRIQKYLFVLFITLNCNLVNAQSVEYAVKATFIEKFARLTDWQGELKGDYFVIDVLGESPFKGELENITRNVRIKNKPVKINYISDIEEMEDCNVMFICNSQKKNIQKILQQLEYKKVLTISETPGLAKKGTHFNFYIDQNETVKFEINLQSFVKSNLRADMYLLSFGKIVNQI